MSMQKVLEMKTENEENIKLNKAAIAQKEKTSSAQKVDSHEGLSSELELPRWSVITYESVEASGLSYNKALRRIKKLDKKGISGLCIVSDEAAARVSKKN